MKTLACSIAGLLAAYNLPYVLVIIRHRKELPPYWKQSVVVLIGHKVRSTLQFLLRSLALVLALGYCAYQRIKYDWNRAEAGFLAPLLMIFFCLIGYLVAINWLDAHGLNRY